MATAAPIVAAYLVGTPYKEIRVGKDGVEAIKIVPGGLPGFLMLIVEYANESEDHPPVHSTARFLCSPSTLVLLLGEDHEVADVPKPPGLYIPKQTDGIVN